MGHVDQSRELVWPTHSGVGFSLMGVASASRQGVINYMSHIEVISFKCPFKFRAAVGDL